MKRTVISAKKRASALETRNITNLKEWKFVANFNSYSIYAKDDIRRLIDTDTGRVIAQYKFKNSVEGDKNARL